MAYSGMMYVCLNEDEPHIGHQWTSPVGDRVLCPGVTADEVIKRLRAQLHEAERLAQIHVRQAWQREDITRAERDAAIKRGAWAIRSLCHQRNGARRAAVLCADAAKRFAERAEAAEALAEERGKLVYEIDHWCWQWGRPTGWSDRAKHALRGFSPAEAQEE